MSEVPRANVLGTLDRHCCNHPTVCGHFHNVEAGRAGATVGLEPPSGFEFHSATYCATLTSASLSFLI